MLNIVRINSFDKEGLRKRYRLFRVNQKDKNIIDISKSNSNIIWSVAYSTPQDFCVLADIGSSIEDMKKVFTPLHFNVKDINIDEIESWQLANLFINKQANPDLMFNNLTAECYFIMDSKKNETITLGFSLDRDMILSCKVKTFSKVSDKTLQSFSPRTRKAIEQGKLTKYGISGKHIVRSTENSKQGYQVMRKSRTSKNTMNYFATDFTVNKTAEMFALLRRINNEEMGLIELGFSSTDVADVLETKRITNDKQFKKIVARAPEGMKMNIIDHCGSAEKITKELDALGIQFSCSNSVDKDSLNLSIVRSVEDYKKSGDIDEYASSKDVVIQNIVNKNLSKATIRQCWLEALLKYEAVSGNIIAAQMKGGWDFYQLINKTPHRLSIREGHIVSFSSQKISEETSSLLKDGQLNDTRIIDHDGRRAIISNTELRLLPDYDTFLDSKSSFIEEKDGKRVNVARKHRNSLFKEAIDFNSFEYRGSRYYSVGDIGYGMNTTVANSPSTKKIEELGLSIEDLELLMEPNIYQINRIASYPYPFKLMNELFLMNGGKFEDD